MSDTENNDPSSDGTILVLPKPLSNISYLDWYSRPIAGLSVLLRNLLELNEAGLQNLFIYIPLSAIDEGHLLLEQANDRRLTALPSLLTGQDALKEFLGKTKNVKIFLGSFIHSNKELIKAFNSSTAEEHETAYTIAPLTEEEFLQWDHSSLDSETARIEDSTFPSAHLFTLKNSRPLEKESDFEWHNKQLIHSSGLSNDSFMDRVITRRISNWLSHFFVTTSLTPNAITLLSLVIGLGAALLFFQGSYWAILAGSVALQISAWVDCVDGEVARLKFMKSEIGAEFDILCDNIVHVSVFFCMGMGLYFETGEAFYKILGAFAVLGNLLSFALLSQSIIKGKNKADSHKTEESRIEKKSEEPPEIANRDFTYYLLGFSLFGYSSWFLALTAVGSNVFAGYLIYSKKKQQKVL